MYNIQLESLTQFEIGFRNCLDNMTSAYTMYWSLYFIVLTVAGTAKWLAQFSILSGIFVLLGPTKLKLVGG